MSGLFRGSQINWACLTKEAYAIYMSVKKLTYYLEDADVTLRSDHLPLKKFLAKNTLNSKVNNWAIEISPFQITFEYIKGIKNTLANMMSRLINIDPQIQPEPELDGYGVWLLYIQFCVLLKTKAAEEVIQAYIDNVYSKFGGSLKMLSDNGTEFKNKIFEQVAKELGVECKLYTPPCHLASNCRIEGFHAFLKACIAKHVVPQLEWDVLVPLACAAYNFIPNEHSKESPFFLMFGRDPVLPLNTLLGPKMKYLGNDIKVLSLEAMKICLK